jgi:hypothetical protein
VNHIDGGLNVFDGRSRQNTVTQIKDEPWAFTSLLQYCSYPSLDFVKRSKESDRI